MALSDIAKIDRVTQPSPINGRLSSNTYENRWEGDRLDFDINIKSDKDWAQSFLLGNGGNPTIILKGIKAR